MRVVLNEGTGRPQYIRYTLWLVSGFGRVAIRSTSVVEGADPDENRNLDRLMRDAQTFSAMGHDAEVTREVGEELVESFSAVRKGRD